MGAAQGLDLPLPLLLKAGESRRQRYSAGGRRGGRGSSGGPATATPFGVVEEPAHPLLARCLLTREEEEKKPDEARPSRGFSVSAAVVATTSGLSCPSRT